MGIIGEELRSAREKRGVTLEEAEEVTKIRVRYLEALENEEFNVIPGRVYIKGFLKNYAEFLDLDSERLLKTLNEIHSQNFDEFEEDNFPATPTFETSTFSNKYIYLITALFCIIIFGAFVNLLYGNDKDKWEINNISESNTPKNAYSNKGQTRVDNQASEPNQETENKSQTNAESADREDNNAVSRKSLLNKVSLVLTATKKDSWALIKVDGKQKFLGIIKKNQEVSFQGKKSIYVHLGNSGAVEIVYNGNRIKPIGPLNTVRKKTFTEKGIQ